MTIHEVQSESLFDLKKSIFPFIRQNGDKRITHQAVNWLKNLTPSELDKGGNLVLVFKDKNKIVGLFCINDYGKKEIFFVVDKEERNKGIGKMLGKYAIGTLGKLYARIAADNTPSLKAAFSVGMVAFDCFEGPTGKQTLWLGAGNWDRNEILK